MKSMNWGLKATFSLIALLISFSLGYWTGVNKSASAPNMSLSNSDMERAFGKVTSAANELDNLHSTNDATAKSLGDLVVGLEKKVLANPDNVDQQLLLAQTYNELGSHDKSLKLLNHLSDKFPKDAQIKLTLATVLMKSDNSVELQNSLKAFDAAVKLNPEMGKMARMYQDEIRSRLKSMK